MSKARQNVDKLNGWINVREFGAKGDNVTDDTAAIQAALAAAAAAGLSVVVDAGTYVVTGLLTANATVLFDGGRIKTTHTIKVNGTASLLGRNNGGLTFLRSSSYIGRSPNFYDTQVLCGLDATWSGCIDGLVIRAINLEFCYLLSVWNGDGWEISNNNLVDMYAETGGSLVGTPNSSTAISGTMPRLQKNGKIYANSITYVNGPTATQVYGLFQSENVEVFNNTSVGGGDDIINIDRCDRVAFDNNYVSTRIGNVIVNFTTNFRVIGNTIIKENSSFGHGPGSATDGGIRLQVVDISQAFAAKNGIVANNLIIGNDATNDMAFPISASGIENVIIANNICINNRSNANFTVVLGISNSVIPGSNLYNKNVIVKNNTIVRGKLNIQASVGTGSTAENGVISIGNVVDAGGYAGPAATIQAQLSRADYSANNVGKNALNPADNLNQDGDAFLADPLIARAVAASVTTSSTLQPFTGVNYIYFPKKHRLGLIAVYFSNALAATVTCSVYTNSGSGDVLYTVFDIQPGARAGSFTAGNTGEKLSRLIVPVGTGLKLTLTSSGAGSVDAEAFVYGSPFVFS
jgi:hypothetical protein